ncbi:shikimate 5-dehydrogenase [soil metagenome]
MDTNPFQITGHTRFLAILADPIHHVKTPQRINELLRAQGMDAVMVPLHVAADDLATVMNALRHVPNFSGCVVTVPHKTKALALCDEVSDEARQIGAVNVVHRLPDGRLRGGMLDGIGFVEGLRGAGIDPSGARVYLAGAGGAASAIAFSLAQAGVRHLTVANRSAGKAAGIVERLGREYPALSAAVGSTDPSGHDIVVNATSLGLRAGDALPLDASKLSSAQIVAEIIMDPAETELLKAARARGCRVHEGVPMLASQIRLMAAFMLDQPLLARPA